MVEQGSHEELLTNRDGTYYGLVHAQKLMMTDSLPDNILEEKTRSFPIVGIDDVGESQKSLAKLPVIEMFPFQVKGFIGSFGLLLYEQRHRWNLYVLVLLAAMGCAAAYPLQAFLFAKIITTFQLTGSAIIHASEHWGLMFFFLALGVSIMYLALGWFANILAVVCKPYMQCSHFLC